jgi:hypothetical protein
MLNKNLISRATPSMPLPVSFHTPRKTNATVRYPCNQTINSPERNGQQRYAYKVQTEHAQVKDAGPDGGAGERLCDGSDSSSRTRDDPSVIRSLELGPAGARPSVLPLGCGPIPSDSAFLTRISSRTIFPIPSVSRGLEREAKPGPLDVASVVCRDGGGGSAFTLLGPAFILLGPALVPVSVGAVDVLIMKSPQKSPSVPERKPERSASPVESPSVLRRSWSVSGTSTISASSSLLVPSSSEGSLLMGSGESAAGEKLAWPRQIDGLHGVHLPCSARSLFSTAAARSSRARLLELRRKNRDLDQPLDNGSRTSVPAFGSHSRPSSPLRSQRPRLARAPSRRTHPPLSHAHQACAAWPFARPCGARAQSAAGAPAAAGSGARPSAHRRTALK